MSHALFMKASRWAPPLFRHEKRAGYFLTDLRGRPWRCGVDARPNMAGSLACQPAESNGCWQFRRVRSGIGSVCEGGGSSENGSSVGTEMGRGSVSAGTCRWDQRHSRS